MARIIDAHAHIFPSKIAEKAVDSIGHFYDIPMQNAGISDELIKSGNTIGVEKYLVCSVATKPEQVLAINDFIFDECQKHKEFIGFATLHPNMQNLEQEVERIISRGFYGIKLHPDFQEFNIDDEKAMEIYRLIEGKMFVLIHTGDERYNFSRPKRLAKVCEKFPNLKCIAAHFGGFRQWQEAYDVYNSQNIYMDTSSSLFEMDTDMSYKMLEKFGYDHFFFGTDFPMWSHVEELKRLKALNLPQNQLDAILYDNFNNAIIKKK
ncbi:MAG: amidohydrolase family protein [Oscillospiraceae bacterium]